MLKTPKEIHEEIHSLVNMVRDAETVINGCKKRISILQDELLTLFPGGSQWVESDHKSSCRKCGKKTLWRFRDLETGDQTARCHFVCLVTADSQFDHDVKSFLAKLLTEEDN